MDQRQKLTPPLNAEAFIERFENQKTELYRIARSYFRNPADAEDAVAETALRAWDKRHALRNPDRFRPWITSILINVCRDMLRKQKRLVLMAEIPEESDVAADPADAVFVGLMSLLSDRIRPVMVLYYAAGFKTAEIARILHVPSGTVTSRLKRGRQQLADKLEKEGELHASH